LRTDTYFLQKGTGYNYAMIVTCAYKAKDRDFPEML